MPKPIQGTVLAAGKPPEIPPGGTSRRPRRYGQPPDLPSAVVDRHGAGRYLGLGLSTLAELTAAGVVPSLKIGRRRLYRLEDLADWLAAQVTGGAA